MSVRREAWHRARRRLLERPTNSNLRRFLKAKARLGWWDDRYCAYYGVSPAVNRGCRRAIMRGYAAGLVPTSTKRLPVSSTASFHRRRNARGEGMAVDLGLRRELVGTAAGRDRMAGFQRAELRRRRVGRIAPVELNGPDNAAIVLRGAETDLAEGSPLETDHDDHVHEAYLG